MQTFFRAVACLYIQSALYIFGSYLLSLEDHSTNQRTSILVTHGLAGHAWNSFTTWIAWRIGQYKEVNWLRDILPNLLSGYARPDGQQGIYARIMTFGYNSNIWVNASPIANFDDAVNNLIAGLNRERRVVRKVHLSSRTQSVTAV